MAIGTTGRISDEATYRNLALADPDGLLELHDGRLREKPAMSAEHRFLVVELAHQLRAQLEPREYQLWTNHARLRRSPRHYSVPDVAVIPALLARRLFDIPGSLDAYAEPLPLVGELWSPATGEYALADKLPDYERRGDLEIWRLHPGERTATSRRRRPDGSYTEIVYRGGFVPVTGLPGVTIDLDALFALLDAT